MSIRPRTALLSALACLALLALDWLVAFHIGFFRHADQSVYLQFGDLQGHGRIAWAAHHFVALFDPNPYVYLVLVPLVLALLRGRPRVVLAVGAIVLGANASTEILKHLVAAPRPGSLFLFGFSPLPPASWPSGHSTAVMSLVLASMLAAPARLRPAVAALGAVLAVAVGYSLLADGLHYPSDVLGGFLVAAAWTLGMVAALQAAEGWRPVNRGAGATVSLRAALGAPGAVLVGTLLVTGLLAALRPHAAVSYVRGHEAFLLGAAGIAGLSLALATGVLLSVRR
jgi:membrane-associated phospholipid phosphatase